MTDSTSTFIDANCEGERITGYAKLGRGSGYFDVPLFTKVFGNLWQGGTPAQKPSLAAHFDKILCLFPWEEYAVPPTTDKVDVEMYDDVEQGFEQVEELSDMVVEWVNDGNMVLVHCQAGLNRSSLVAAVAYMKLNPLISGTEVIRRLRENRCNQVLCNTAFENYVMSWKPSV